MSELYKVIREYESDAESMRKLGSVAQLKDSETVKNAHNLAVSSIESRIESEATPGAVDELFQISSGFSWAERDQPAGLFGGSERRYGELLVQAIFGDDVSEATQRLANAAEIKVASATSVLRAVSAVTMATAIAGQQDRTSFGDLIGSTATGARSEVVQSRSKAASGAGSEARLEKSSASLSANGKPEKGLSRVLFGAAALFVAAGAVFAVVRSGSDDPVENLAATDDSEETTDTAADPSESSNADGEGADDPADSTDEANQPAPDEDSIEQSEVESQETQSTSIVSYNIPMVDIENPDRAANGILSFDFDTETGEVCYRVSSSDIEGPYRTHIHIGGPTEKGGIVVDMGPQENGAVGCLDNLPSDTLAILADLDNHYAELHDVSEEWTIRGQLSDSVELGASDVTDSDVILEFAPEGGGAYLSIENGTVVLRGEVPNLETATALISLYAAPESGLEITNAVTVNAAAPSPSGRVVLADHRFGSGSDQVPAVSAENEQVLEALLGDDGGWKVTAVGRTDGAGSDLDNLELSLRRAKSLRVYLESLEGLEPGTALVRGAGELGLNDRQLELVLTPQS